ncbi:MAG TPA: hypothetical protein VER33_04115 [Polyangiaceae bacterium]|nr:hypothetical protein [Polyangiaceae bacterium]
MVNTLPTPTPRIPFPTPARVSPASSRSAWWAAALLAAFTAACGGADSAVDPPPGEKPVHCSRVIVDGGGGISQPPAGASACAAGICNYQTQLGCPEDQTCRPRVNADGSDVAPGCEPSGTGPAGARCSESTDCAAGTLCLEGICRKQCCAGDWTACDSGESCIAQLLLELPAGLEPAVDLCLPVGTCDVLDAESCAAEPGRDCKIVDPTGAVACVPRSNAALGEPCGPGDACAAGLTCVGGACRRLCRAEACAEPMCRPGEGACVHFDRNPPGVGECTLER